MKSLAELAAIRDKMKDKVAIREGSGAIRVVVGMATCGIAAGAKETFTTLIDMLNEKSLTNVLVRQTGCMGLCHSEPTVEVVVPGMPSVIYGNVDAAMARDIVEKHIIGKSLIDAKICERPSVDIVKQG